MAIEGVKDLIPGLVTAANLSAKQFYFVKMSADFTVALCNGATDCPAGILQEASSTATGAEASVAFKGISKVILGGTVAAGDRVGTDGDGKAVKLIEGTDTTKYIVGQMLDGGDAGEICSVLLSGTPHRAS